jgi:hypothetical protein
MWQAQQRIDIDRYQYLVELAVSRVQLALNVDDIEKAVSRTGRGASSGACCG